MYDMGKLCSTFGEDWSTNNVTFLSTDAGRTDGRLCNLTFCPVLCTALDRQRQQQK